MAQQTEPTVTRSQVAALYAEIAQNLEWLRNDETENRQIKSAYDIALGAVNDAFAEFLGEIGY